MKNGASRKDTPYFLKLYKYMDFYSMASVFQPKKKPFPPLAILLNKNKMNGIKTIIDKQQEITRGGGK